MKRIGLIFALILALLLTMLPMTAMAAVGDGAEFEDGDISVPVGPGGNVPVPGSYTVTFKDRNGSTLSSETYTYGATLTFPQVQDPIVDVYGTHTFVGWRDSNGQAAPDTCIGAATYTATYETVWNEYTVTFKDEDGSTLATGSGYHYGDTVHVPADPTKADDDTYTYTFAGWDKEITTVTGDAVYTATYTKTEKNPIDTSKNGWYKENGDWYYYQKGVALKNAWMKDTKGWCFLGADGAMETDTFVRDSKGMAYVDASGYYYEINGWKNLNGVWYYLEKGYRVQSAWRKDSKGWCFLEADGAMATNTFVRDSKGMAYVDASGYFYEINGWKKVDGVWYYLEKGYRVQSAWRKDSKGWCYLGADGAMLTETWVKDSKGWCWVDASGYIVYNKWVTDSGNQYYVDAAGYRVTGEHTIEGETYYFDENGVCQASFLIIFKNDDGTVLSSKRYAEGAIVKVPADPTKAPDANYIYTFAGWDKLIGPVTGDAVYTATYTKEERPADLKNGWHMESGKWYFYEQGIKVTKSWRKDSKGWCYLGEDGAMLINSWVKDSKGWCFVGADGYMIYNDLVINYANGQIYYVDPSGYMVTNYWLGEGNEWVYFGSDGAAVINGWVYSGGKWYYMGADGLMLYSCSATIGGKTYHFNASGVCTNP